MKKIIGNNSLSILIFWGTFFLTSCTRTIPISDGIYLGMASEDYYKVLKGDYISIPYVGNGKAESNFSYSHLVGLKVTNTTYAILDSSTLGSIGNYYINKFGKPQKFEIKQSNSSLLPDEKKSLKGLEKTLNATWVKDELTVELNASQSLMEINSKIEGIFSFYVNYTTGYDFSNQFNPNKEKTSTPSL